MKKTLYPFLILFFLPVLLQAQSFQIKRFGIEDGICHESTYSIIQDHNGSIWISTAQGLCRLNGKSFSTQFLGDILPNTIIISSFKDSQDRIWFGYVDGVIALLENNRFRVIQAGENMNSLIVGFAEDDQGNILAMTQRHGMIIIDDKLDISYITEPFTGIFVSEFLLTHQGNLMVGGFDGLTLFTVSTGAGKYSKAGRIEGIPFTQVQEIKQGLAPNEYWVGTKDEGLYRVVGTWNIPSDYTVINVGETLGLEYSSIQSILIDNTGFLWLSDYGKGVYRFRINKNSELENRLFINIERGLPEAYIKEIMKDDEGNIWFATQDNGVAILRDQAFTFYDLSDDNFTPEITAISIRGDNYWFGTRHGELYWSDEYEIRIGRKLTSANGLPGERITALWQDENSNLYVGTEASGVFYLKNTASRFTKFFEANNSLGNTINAINGDERAVWIATNNGIYEIIRSDGTMKRQSTNTGLPHNVINDVLIDRVGAVWIATKGSGIYCVNEMKDYTISGNPKLEFNSLIEDETGRIWAGTNEDGVFIFDKDSLGAYSVEEGLKSKYTYGIAADSKGYIWVGHRLGLSMIDPDKGNILTYGMEMGFTSDVHYRAIKHDDDHGLVIFGTNHGIIVHDTYQSRQDTIAPRLSITELNISDSIYDASEHIKLPYSTYRIRIDFVGINLSNPDQVTYRYKLNGFDDWSEPTTESAVYYSRIEDGEYTFMVMACDGYGNCTGEETLARISVRIPLWKAWWFIVSLVVIAIAAVFLFIKIREKNHIALQEYLEQQLQERTREVLHQKEEIEIKNRDITDSINYAQRIQASILPPVQRLHQTFAGSFVFYQPRDIVSGDFYWYDKLDDERFLIVCADSTGHGVPGAFMSMIGTTLIKDICLRDDVKTPAEVLKTLDDEVREALHQNKETTGSNDGMDIIVAEINLKTNMFVVSSAMRPVIVYMGGEQIYVKGSRSSVGGQLDDPNLDKEFINEEFQLSKGDIIYMFSDGYPDQFGGPLGRKFKMVRLKNLLRDIHDKPMVEQYNYVKSNFFLWKEDLEQVDDVLFMGIKI
ncbi:MAG: SpoIIE family protein phosphatase [Bacteroidales bacterium]